MFVKFASVTKPVPVEPHWPKDTFVEFVGTTAFIDPVNPVIDVASTQQTLSITPVLEAVYGRPVINADPVELPLLVNRKRSLKKTVFPMRTALPPRFMLYATPTAAPPNVTPGVNEIPLSYQSITVELALFVFPRLAPTLNVETPDVVIDGAVSGTRYTGDIDVCMLVESPTATAESVLSSGMESVVTATVVNAPKAEDATVPVWNPLPNV